MTAPNDRPLLPHEVDQAAAFMRDKGVSGDRLFGTFCGYASVLKIVAELPPGALIDRVALQNWLILSATNLRAAAEALGVTE